MGKNRKKGKTKNKNQATDEAPQTEVPPPNPELKAKIEQLKARFSQRATPTRVGGQRLTHKKGGLSQYATKKRKLSEVFNKFPAQPVNRVDLNQIVILFPDRQMIFQNPISSSEKKGTLWYIQKPTCFILEGQNQNPILLPFNIEEVGAGAPPMPTEARTGNRQERNLKALLQKKEIISEEPKLCFLGFDLEKEIWQLQNGEYYTTANEQFHIFFGDLRVINKAAMRMEESARRLAASKQQSESSEFTGPGPFQLPKQDQPEAFQPPPTLPNDSVEGAKMEDIPEPESGDTNLASSSLLPDDYNCDIPEADIKLIMNQANVSREKAISTLIDVDGDLVQAMMNLV